MRDPWTVLGIVPGSSLDQARAARRRLAKQLHPDLHAGRPPAERAELARRMTLVNLALAELEGGVPAARPTAPEGPRPPAAMLDADTFAVGALPAEAFEALFLVAYGLGEILLADEPYALDTYLAEPAPCFCQLTLVPEAGGSIVTLELVPAEGTELPTVEAVRDLFISELNELAGAPSP